MQKKSNIKPLILTIIAGLTFTIAVISASFAYFIAQKGTGSSANAVVKTETTDALTFQVGNPINIEANQANFGSGTGNKSYETTATVNLRANTGNNTATYNFYVYLDIITNNFEYTSGNTPELLMTLTDQYGNEVKTLEGYNYVTSGGVSGFDVTRKNGLIELVDNKVITTTSNVSETWKVKITFVNLSGDQQNNTGKTFTGAIKIQKDMIPTIATSCVGQNMASCIKTNYQLDRLDYHTSSLANSAEDVSVRYSGANPNNYVCFGSNEAVCPEYNLYRIIGVFEDKIKLIKKSTTTSMSWDSIEPYDNNWETSDLKTYLNGSFLTSFSNFWSDKISLNSWQIGGIDWYKSIDVPKITYQYELGINKINLTADAKIGLMYVSDFGYAASPNNWETMLFATNRPDYRTVAKDNWMFNGSEWTITKLLHYTNLSIYIFKGNTGNGPTNLRLSFRPVFYLQSGTNLTSGAGTEQNPYRIS